MYSSLSRQTWALCLLSLIAVLTPNASLSAPSLWNVSITPGGENSQIALGADISSGGGGQMTLRVNWGDGTQGAITYANTETNFLVGHYYEDDDPSGTAGDIYTVSVTLSNNTGSVTTNLGVLITNVPPRLTLSINSPIEIEAPATLRGLEITEFPVGAGTAPNGITLGPDGNIWFTETGSNRVSRITTNGVITHFNISGPGRGLVGIAPGSDGRLWFCASTSSSGGDGKIGAITTAGVATMYAIPRLGTEPIKTPQYITRGGGLNNWYSDLSYRIGRVSPSGVITQFVHQAGVNPWGIAYGADNNIWFTAYFSDTVNRQRLSDGATTSYQLDNLASPALMTRGPDGAVWFTEFQAGKIGRITTNGVLTEAFVGRSQPYGICTGLDGAIWFTERRQNSSNSIARLTVGGQLSRYQVNLSSDPAEICAGPDGALWFTMPGRDRIGRLRYTTYGNVVLSANLNDPGYLDTHVVSVNWGDGSAVETLNLPAGIDSIHLAHTYSGSQPFYVVTVGATDDDVGSSQASTIVVVNAIRFTSATRSGTEVRLKGTGANGRTITIESSTDMLNWSTAGTVNSVSNQFEFVQPGASGTKRFYRGKLP